MVMQYLVDIVSKMDEVSLSFHGKQLTAFVTYDNIKAFK